MAESVSLGINITKVYNEKCYTLEIYPG